MRATFLAVTLALTHAAAAEKDTLPPLKDGRVPRSVDEIWKDFDPRREPLETEVLKEWEDDGLVCRIVRFRVGVFKGVKSWVGGLYAFLLAVSAPRNTFPLQLAAGVTSETFETVPVTAPVYALRTLTLNFGATTALLVGSG